MKPIKESGKAYLKTLQERSKNSRVYKDYQSIGLQIAETLNDLKHKSLYIKLAKTQNKEKLLVVAKTVAENPKILNPGAYFMRLIQKSKK